MRRELESEYEEKLSQMDNHFNGLLAKERQAKSKIELRNAEIEAELEEIKREVKKSLEEATARGEDKENQSKPNSSRVSTDKELSKRLKKLSRTISLK